jgi:hypothetical protein
MDHARKSHRLVVVKRISPLLVIAIAAAAALALIRSSEEPEPSEHWKPVQPS